jgi:hypothetical protein
MFASSLSPPGWFPAWWGFWLASNFVGNIYFRLTTDVISREVIFSFGVVLNVITIIAGWLATMVVNDIDQRQTLAAAEIAQPSGGPLPPPPPVFENPIASPSTQSAQGND